MNQRDATVTQLSLKGLFSLLEEGKKGLIVQIIESEMISNQRAESKSLKFKVSISDGYTKSKAVLASDAATLFENAGNAENAVVRVLDLMQPNAQTIVITKIDILNSDVTEVIGQPIEYNEWLANGKQNKNGSNQIPARFLPNYRPVNNYSNNSNMNNNMNNNQMNNNSNSNSYNKPNFLQEQNNQQRNAPVTFNNPGPRNTLNNPPTNATRQSFNPSNQNNMNNKPFINQNENIPPYGSNANQQKGGKRQSAISYFDNNNVGHIPDNEFLSVNQLAPFTPFVIKVRVTNKSEIREFKKANSMEMSKVFSVDLIDKEGNEISATFFGQSAEHWYPQIHENGVYIMREGQVKMVNSKFNKKKNDYQIIFETNAKIDPVDNDSDIMVNKFEFVKIAEINQIDPNTTVDIAAYVKNPGEVRAILIKKTGENKDRRVLTVYDDSNTLVEFTCWGDLANGLNVQTDDLILIKEARVSEFGGSRSLSSSFGTKVITDHAHFPESPIIQNLMNWRNTEFNDDALQSMVTGGGGNRKFNPWTVDEINQQQNNIHDKGSFDTIAYVSHVRQEGNIIYAGCERADKCSKKAWPLVDDMYECRECNITFKQPVYHYTLSLRISDQTGSMWIRAFDKVGTTILGYDANKIQQMRQMHDDAAINEIFREAANQEYNFRLFAKREDNNQNPGETRVTLQATRVEKINYAKDGQALVNLLEEFGNLKT